MNSVARPQYEINEYPVTSRQTEILQLLSQGKEMTTAQIIALMQNPPPIRTLKYDLTKLKQNGLIDTRRHARSAVWFLLKK